MNVCVVAIYSYRTTHLFVFMFVPVSVFFYVGGVCIFYGSSSEVSPHNMPSSSSPALLC